MEKNDVDKKFLIKLSIGLLAIAYHQKKITDKELNTAEKYLLERGDN